MNVISRLAPFARAGRRAEPGLRFATMVLAAMVALPLLVLASGWLHSESEVWKHLLDTVLLELLRNTLLLLLGVGCGVLVIGVGLAWLTSMYEFPGRRLFDWALMLPLAMPAYVLAFVSVGLLDFSGPVQTTLRGLFGTGLRLPSIRSEGGVILILTLAFYPYVYLLARSAFIAQGRSIIEAARVSGLGPRAAFLRVAVPAARPAIMAGLALAMMETLADFGAVSVFNYDTFTTAIYKAWFGLFKLQAAAQLATLLLLLVALALTGERMLRGRARYHEGAAAKTHRVTLNGNAALGAWTVCSVVLFIAFLIPIGQLLVWAISRLAEDLDSRYLSMLFHTLTLGAVASTFTLIGAVILAWVRKRDDSNAVKIAVRTATLGYALPGSVLAVGIMISLTWFDIRLAAMLSMVGIEVGTILRGTVWALLLAYFVRFLAVSFGPVESALERIKPSIGEAARGLGCGQKEVLRRVYLPLLRPGLVTALLLVLVDVMKEMPATLLLRPFGWDTLAVRIYEMTSEGEWERAAVPALTLVLAGLLPVIMLVKRSRK